MPQLIEEVMKHESLSNATRTLLEIISDNFSGTESATIEDYMSEIVDLLSITERRTKRDASKSKVKVEDQDKDGEQFQIALDEIKQAILSIISNKEIDIIMQQHYV